MRSLQRWQHRRDGVSHRLRRLPILTAAFGVMMVSSLPQPALAATLEPEPVGTITSLPSPYPAHWLIVHDTAFNHMREGKLFIVDPRIPGGGQIKGILSADFFASFLIGHARNEFYVVESFHSRGGRGGERTDVVTIYDPATLGVKAEVVVPAKRLTGMPNRFQTTLTGDGRFLLIYNFTPAQSVTVVDVVQQKVAEEVPLPGCAFTIPVAARGFLSICSDGSARSTLLQEDGSVADAVRIPPFIDVDEDAMMEKPAIVNGVAYFPTFTGNLLPIDVSAHPARVMASWSLTTAQERSAGWRPGGAWPAAGDAQGRVHVLMHSHGAEGTHKDGGDQVWSYDAATGTRIGDFALREWGLAITVAATDPASIIVTGAAGSIDLYSAQGDHNTTLDLQMEFPLFVHSLSPPSTRSEGGAR
ncbi:MAG: hypothetical protein KDI31_17460 [Pseudomonadales bacterium]|nr:hypothetical protein [Pseudomonadales bacterium]